MWFKRLLMRWVRQASEASRPDQKISVDTASPPASGLNGEHVYSVALRKAMNGVILELGAYKPNPRGPDWTYTHFLVPEGESIPDAVTALLVNQRLTS